MSSQFYTYTSTQTQTVLLPESAVNATLSQLPYSTFSLVSFKSIPLKLYGPELKMRLPVRTSPRPLEMYKRTKHHLLIAGSHRQVHEHTQGTETTLCQQLQGILLGKPCQCEGSKLHEQPLPFTPQPCSGCIALQITVLSILLLDIHKRTSVFLQEP